MVLLAFPTQERYFFMEWISQKKEVLIPNVFMTTRSAREPV